MSLKISAVVPVYNCEKYLSKTLDSCLSQDIGDFEIICVNDGSTDSSLEILESYKNKDSRIIVIDQENTGAGIARNRALKTAKGEFVAFIDADDWYPDEHVWSFLYSKAKENNVKAAGGIVNRYFYDKVDELYPERVKRVFSTNSVVHYSDIQYDYGYQAYIFEREYLRINNINLAETKRFQDPPFLVKALSYADKIYVSGKVTYCYRRENVPSSISSEKLADILTGVFSNIKHASSKGYRDLYKLTLDHINELGYEYYYKIIDGDEKLYSSLIRLNSEIDPRFIDPDGTGEYILFPLKLLSSNALRYETLRGQTVTRLMSAVPRRMIERKLEKEGK